MKQLADEMVASGSSISIAAANLGLPLTKDELIRTASREEFRGFLRKAKNELRTSVADDPARTKRAAVGAMWLAIEGLLEEGKNEEAVSAIEKLGKIEGWVGADSNINIFQGMTARDIENEKKRILEKLELSKQSAGEAIASGSTGSA
jgi:hypothetical protein